MKVKMTIEIEIDDELFNFKDEDESRWMKEFVLSCNGGLSLHSNEIGDTVGVVTSVNGVAFYGDDYKSECQKEKYLLEYFGVKDFDENRKVETDLGILTDLLYGWEQRAILQNDTATP